MDDLSAIFGTVRKRLKAHTVNFPAARKHPIPISIRVQGAAIAIDL
jgi:hypothetical protein